MSSNVENKYFYRMRGKKIELWMYRRDYGGGGVNSDGVVTDSSHSYKYPDEAITEGLRVEYTAFINPFVSSDPNTLATGDENETTWTNPTLTAVTAPEETTHVNLNRMLSLSVVSYVRAMLAENAGDLEKKEYYMREFWKRVADNESNKRTGVSITYPIPVFSVR